MLDASVMIFSHAGIMEEVDLQAIWDVIETRLQQYRQLDPGNINGENGEVLLRHSLQMCQWVSLMEPFILGVDVLLEALIEVSCALEFEVERSHCRRRGRPCFPISKEQLLFFVQHNFKVTEIARLFGCSRRTVERRMQEYHISGPRSCYSRISDSDLQETIGTLCSRNPNLGEKSIDGLLRAQGIIVQ